MQITIPQTNKRIDNNPILLVYLPFADLVYSHEAGGWHGVTNESVTTVLLT